VAARPACVATNDVAAPTSKVFENVRLFIIMMDLHRLRSGRII
jgi:hypothetical protein